MSAFLLGWFRLIWLFARGHQALVLENLGLRQQSMNRNRTATQRRVPRQRLGSSAPPIDGNGPA